MLRGIDDRDLLSIESKFIKRWWWCDYDSVESLGAERDARSESEADSVETFVSKLRKEQSQVS